MGKSKTEKALDILKIREALQPLFEFKLNLSRIKISSLSTEKRMEQVVIALAMGLSPKTAQTLCRVTSSQVKDWLLNPNNKESYENALAMAEAQLELIAFEAAQYDPNIAVRLLDKRNTSRWKSPADDKTLIPGEEVKARIKMSEMLKNALPTTITDEFDVEST